MLAYQQGGGEAAYELAQKRGLLNANGDLRLTLELDTNDTASLAAELEAKGFQVTAIQRQLDGRCHTDRSAGKSGGRG